MKLGEFISEYKLLCIASCGLAIVGYLGYRTVEWILEKTGLIGKVDAAAETPIKKVSEDFSKLKPLFPKNTTQIPTDTTSPIPNPNTPKSKKTKTTAKPPKPTPTAKPPKPTPTAKPPKPTPTAKPPKPTPTNISQVNRRMTISENKALAAEYGVHGLSNPSNYCYANSAYQLVSNIDTLREFVIETIPDDGDLALLKDYDSIESGDDLLDIINGRENMKTPFTHGVQYAASDIIQEFINNAPDFTTPIISKKVHLIDPNGSLTDPTNRYSMDKEEELSGIFVDISKQNKNKKSIDFIQSLKDSFKVEQNTYDDESKQRLVLNQILFKEAPKHLFITIGRLANIKKKNSKPINIDSKVLDLNSCDTMNDKVKAKPLYLKGFTVHSGNHIGGHYVAYFEKSHPTKPNQSQWFKADDSAITAIREDEVLKFAKQATDLYYDDIP